MHGAIADPDTNAVVRGQVGHAIHQLFRRYVYRRTRRPRQGHRRRAGRSRCGRTGQRMIAAATGILLLGHRQWVHVRPGHRQWVHVRRWMDGHIRYGNRHSLKVQLLRSYVETFAELCRNSCGVTSRLWRATGHGQRVPSAATGFANWRQLVTLDLWAIPLLRDVDDPRHVRCVLRSFIPTVGQVGHGWVDGQITGGATDGH